MSNVLRGVITNPDVIRGKSAYEIAVMQGFNGTEEEWIKSLKGEKGDTSINVDDLGLEQDAETGIVYPTYLGVRSENGIPLAATGGGGAGGGGGQYKYTLKNKTFGAFSVSKGAEAKIAFSYSSVELDEEGKVVGDDGAGIGYISVGDTPVATVNVPQGDNAIDVAPYLSEGENTVRIRVANSESHSNSIRCVITVVTLEVKPAIGDAKFIVCKEGKYDFYYTLNGAGTKKVWYRIDTQDPVEVDGTNKYFTISDLSHGAHTLTVWAEVESGVTKVPSEPLKYGIIWAVKGDERPIISYLFDKVTASEGETIAIPYYAYNPTADTTEVIQSIIKADGSVYSTKTEYPKRKETEWTITDYPVGNIKFRFTVGGVNTDIDVAVSEVDNGIQIESGYVFKFAPKSGMTNSVDNPAQWEYVDGNGTTYAARFTGVGFGEVDGWQKDNDGNPVLRLLPGGKVEIPYTLFNTDKKTNGVTIEVEMATQNVRDYESVVMSCLSGGRGFEIASQNAQFKSLLNTISMQFKEDERVRLSFVVEPFNKGTHLICVYVDGIMCGAVQYLAGDEFKQSNPVGITIGGTTSQSGIDVYRIYMYNYGLKSAEILDNYIADRPTLDERLKAHRRNNVINSSTGEIDQSMLKEAMASLPRLTISCAELPTTKKYIDCDITYVDNGDTTKSFTARAEDKTGATIAIQGTSSVDYPVKNFKFKLPYKYALRDTSIPVDTFCLKADYASSEGANNVELVKLYEDICPYKLSEQLGKPGVRSGIDGLPCVVFWHNPNTKETKFVGKYNFNNDKSTPEVFGLTEGCESWEIRNNDSKRVTFNRSDYSTTPEDSWQQDFEARYPDGNTNFNKLKDLTDWLVSTDRSAVTSEEEKAARLKKFKDEFEQHFVKKPTLFYYLFTEVFLMVDSRAKNFFPTTYDGVHWMPLPYDFDTAIGIDNIGKLTFGYSLEDTDKVGVDNVFAGANSVLWCNVRDAFADDIRDMYAELRDGEKTKGTFNYAEIVKRFKDHQDKWCERVWNEDAYKKYIAPLTAGENKLFMLQGNKASQREWWLFNRFRYLDSKYQCGDAQEQRIVFRSFAAGTVNVTPYSDIYPRIAIGDRNFTERGYRKQATTLNFPENSDPNNIETRIYSADRIVDVGDLSTIRLGGLADFSKATKLQNLKLGADVTQDGQPYDNSNLTELDVGNNDLLVQLDVTNCSKLAKISDLSICAGIEIVKAKGSAITNLSLPDGGQVKELYLPSTMRKLELFNLHQLSTFEMEGWGSLVQLNIENTPNIPSEIIEGILKTAPLESVRLVGANMTFADASTLLAIKQKFNEEKAVITGNAHIVSLTQAEYDEIKAYYPNLNIDYDMIGSPVVQLVEGTISGVYRNELVTNVTQYSFYGCKQLEGVDFPNATSIGESAFANLNLKSVNIPNVVTIPKHAFYECELERVELPKVTSIGQYAFALNTGLTALILPSESVCTLDDNGLYNTAIASGTGYIYVNDGLVNDYKNASKWSNYANQIKSINELEGE